MPHSETKPEPSRKLVLIHGIWMTGLELRWLGHRLRACGFEPHFFRYPSLRGSATENARRLAAFLDRAAPNEAVNLVAHSLGGLVVLRMLQQSPNRPTGRILLLGSPLRGSGVAARLARHRFTRWLLGRAWHEGLDGKALSGRIDHPAIGIIAGTAGFGIGRLIGGLETPSDGTVAVSETRFPGLHRLELPVSHFSMLFTNEVAAEACRFLKQGQFGD